MIQIYPSLLAANFIDLQSDIDTVASAGADALHVDVMDGLFVPNISVGLPVVGALRDYTALPLDVHLMIAEPHRYVERFIAAGAAMLGFHFEAGSPVRDTLTQIRALGATSTLAVKPATPAEAIFDVLDYCDAVLVMSVEPGFGGQAFMPASLDKIRALSSEITRRNLTTTIAVDGGIDLTTAPLVAAAGATALIAGSALFRAPDKAKMIRELRAAGETAAPVA